MGQWVVGMHGWEQGFNLSCFYASVTFMSICFVFRLVDVSMVGYSSCTIRNLSNTLCFYMCFTITYLETKFPPTTHPTPSLLTFGSRFRLLNSHVTLFVGVFIGCCMGGG